MLSLGITNQRETTVVWNRTSGEPYYRAIVWFDTRTRFGRSFETNDLWDTVRSVKISSLKIKARWIKISFFFSFSVKDPFRKVTGLPISTYFSAVKLLWMIQNVPEIQNAVEKEECCFGTIDSWIIYNLTNKEIHATDRKSALESFKNAPLQYRMPVGRCF